MKRLLLFALASLVIAVPCCAHEVVDLAVRIIAPEFVAAGATVAVDFIVDANAYDSADDVTFDIDVANARVLSTDPAWECTASAQRIHCTAELIAAGAHPVHVAVQAPASGTLTLRGSVSMADGVDPRDDNNSLVVTSRVYDPAQCNQSAPQITGNFAWTVAQPASSYDVFYGIDGEIEHLVATTNDTHVSLSVPGGDVAWFVRAHYDGCPARDSSQATFTSTNPPVRFAVTTVVASPLASPQSVGVDGSTLYINDAATKMLYTFDVPSGTLTPVTLFGDVVASAPLFDGGITVGPGSIIYDADRSTHSVRFTDSTRYMFFIGGQPANPGTADGFSAAARFDSPAAVAINATGAIFVTDSSDNVIRRALYNSALLDFEITTFAGTTPAGLFNQPTGIAIDSAGNLLVADRGNDVIRIIAPDGTVKTFAGVPATGGHRDGDASTALFDRPYGVAIDPFGNVYVSEEGNRDVRKIAPNRRVTTVAGEPDAHFVSPALLAAAPDGTLWIPDAGNGRLLHAVLATTPAVARRRIVHH